MSVHEARLRRTEAGLTPESDGWFVVNVRDARGTRHPKAGTWAGFESREHRFPHYGINIHVVEPGQANGRYHAETAQESFLVLDGECLLIVEEEERRLRQWDFVHFPPGTRHAVVGIGDRPCTLLMVGARGDEFKIHYPVSDVAARHGASVAAATSDPAEAYADLGREFEDVPMPWPGEEPAGPGSA